MKFFFIFRYLAHLVFELKLYRIAASEAQEYIEPLYNEMVNSWQLGSEEADLAMKQYLRTKELISLATSNM